MDVAYHRCSSKVHKDTSLGSPTAAHPITQANTAPAFSGHTYPTHCAEPRTPTKPLPQENDHNDNNDNNITVVVMIMMNTCAQHGARCFNSFSPDNPRGSYYYSYFSDEKTEAQRG